MSTAESTRVRFLALGRASALVALGLAGLAIAAVQTSGELWDGHAEPLRDAYYIYLLVAPLAWLFSVFAGLARRRRSRSAGALTQLALLVSTPWAALFVWIIVWGMGARTGVEAPKALALIDALFAASVLCVGWLIEDALARSPRAR